MLPLRRMVEVRYGLQIKLYGWTFGCSGILDQRFEHIHILGTFSDVIVATFLSTNCFLGSVWSDEATDAQLACLDAQDWTRISLASD